MSKNKQKSINISTLKSSKRIIDGKFRARVFTSISLLISIAYAGFNGVMAIVSQSIWFGALSGYYVLLMILRGSVLMGHDKKLPFDIISAQKAEINKLKVYRSVGVVLLAIIIALSFAVAQMVESKKSFEYVGLMIYAGAVYTTTKVTIAIVNFVKVKKKQDIALEAIRNINLTDAAVSVLALQTAMFKAFSQGADNAVANAITGAAVCLLILGLGICMIIKSTMAIRRLREL